jgi:DNA-binding response OmpR family regulator
MAYEFRNASILIVEDNFPMLELVRSVVNTFGFEKIHTAKNGREGFKLFCEHNPDLVIADWMMKPINGITLTQMIRTDKRSPNFYVPVILMTGFSQRQRVFEARDSGVTEFMVKPFKADDLYKRIERIIESPRQFVQSPSFFGPDRRRQKNLVYSGPYRRASDTPAEIARDYGNLDKEDKLFKKIMRDQTEDKPSQQGSSYLDNLAESPDSLDIEFVDRTS